nr:hypothetical protein [uncultured bacterium]
MLEGDGRTEIHNADDYQGEEWQGNCQLNELCAVGSGKALASAGQSPRVHEKIIHY